MKPRFPTHAEIDIDRLNANLDLIAKTARVPLLPVVKADAYGHGAVRVAGEIVRRKDVEALCVGTVEEGLELRRAKIKGRVVVLDGVFPEQAKDVAGGRLEVVASSAETARMLAARAGRERIKIHLKINTGMTRLGADPEGAVEQYGKIAKMKKVAIAGVMTHLAAADRKNGLAEKQLTLFEDILSSIKAAGHELPPRHAANTAAVFLHPRSRLDAVRPGLGIYGVQEFEGRNVGLKPVLSWRARVMMVRDLSKGTSVSYGTTWTSPGRRKVAVACAGYADGYHRALSNKVRALYKGKAIRQVGTICMDNCLFDVTGADITPGAAITLIGEDGGKTILAAELAKKAGTIAYEILCGIGRRAPRVYIKGGKVVEIREGV